MLDMFNHETGTPVTWAADSGTYHPTHSTTRIFFTYLCASPDTVWFVNDAPVAAGGELVINYGAKVGWYLPTHSYNIA
jgi:hypothetical protein